MKLELTRTFSNNTIADSTVESSGGKGHNLIQMKRDGLNVPSGVIVPTEVCNEYRKSSPHQKKKLMNRVVEAVMHELQESVWVDSSHKLLSVRSGAPVSMPGMMDTVLNVGAGYEDDDLHADLQADCRRRFVEMYADVVMNFEGEISNPDEWLTSIEKHIPELSDVIRHSIEAVFDSWDNPRAVYYRNLNSIDHEMGTAVIIQSMVFGNYNDKSGSGVLFSRNPSTGEKKVMGEFLINCQGEDVVAGTATPMPLEQMDTWNGNVYNQLLNTAEKLEQKNKDMQDIEFTIQDGELFILQTRNGKRTPHAEIKIALDLLDEGVIEDLGERVKPGTFTKLRIPTLPEGFNQKPIGSGIPAGGYFATGKVVFTSEGAVKCKEPCILVADETTPDDIAGMVAAEGILTFKGGATSHAAVVARGMNKVCVVGAADITVFVDQYVLIDGQTGNVYLSDDKFDLDLTSSLPVDLLGPLFDVVLSDTDWVKVESFNEAMSLKAYIKNVGVPIKGLETSEMITLAETFDRVVLINPERRDHVSDFLGTPNLPEMDNARNMDEHISNNPALKNVHFDSGEWVSGQVVKPYKTMADVMNPNFIGSISEDFLKTVMGDIETFEKLSEELGLSSRIVDMESVLGLLEKRIKIG